MLITQLGRSKGPDLKTEITKRPAIQAEQETWFILTCEKPYVGEDNWNKINKDAEKHGRAYLDKIPCAYKISKINRL